MLISHYQHLEQEEGGPFGPDLVIQGAKERLAPILMTALTTGLALVPLLLAGNIAGQEIEYPMAIVIMGGLLCSTCSTCSWCPRSTSSWARAERRSRPWVWCDGGALRGGIGPVG